MSFPTPTTGVGVAARVVITSVAPTLVLVGASQQLDYQVEAQAEDIDGNVLESQPTIHYSVVAGNDVAAIDTEGLLIATFPGQCIVQAAVGNLNSGFIYAEQTVQVVQGVALGPDFSFTLSSDTVTLGPTDTQTLTITQTALRDYDGPVSYWFCQNGDISGIGNGYQSALLWSSGVQIAGGSGTAHINFSTYAALPGSVTGYIVAGGANPTNTHILPITVTVTA